MGVCNCYNSKAENNFSEEYKKYYLDKKEVAFSALKEEIHYLRIAHCFTTIPF
jgi:hypothetical protein